MMYFSYPDTSHDHRQRVRDWHNYRTTRIWNKSEPIKINLSEFINAKEIKVFKY